MVLEEIQQFRLPRDCRSTLSGVNSYAQWTKGLSCAAESRRRCEARLSGNRRSFQCLHCPVVADLSRSLGSISVADLDDKRRGQERRQRSIQQLEILPAYLPS